MSPNEGEKLNRIEELKSKLFSKNYPTHIEHRDSFSHPKKVDVPDSWPHDETKLSSPEKFFMKSFVFKKFFLFSLGFFVLAMVYASYVFFFGGNAVSNNNIEISVIGNTFTAGGDELPLVVGITNRNNSSLELVDLIVEYPKGSTGDSGNSMERLRQSLGTIPAGGVRNENVKVTLFGEQGIIRPVKISIEYRVEGSNAIFVKEKIHNVTINSTPIQLIIDGPTEISPNQDISFSIKSTVNATKIAEDVLLHVDYPLGFEFVSAEPSPSFGDNVWSMGDLAPGSETDVSISGKMLDVFDGEEKIFRISNGSQSSADKYAIEVVFNSAQHAVLIKKPFIEAQLLVDGVYDREYSVDSKSPIQGEIRWTNNLDTKINDLEIRAKISGNAVDRRSINAQQGFYNSGADEIVWSKNSLSSFREVNPGDSGSVFFSVSSMPLFSGLGGLLSSPSINVDVAISGKQPQEGGSLISLNNSESKTVKITSDVGFAGKLLYYSGPFANKGPIPPKAESTTTYTVIWTLSNTSNNVSKAQVRASLPPWVSFVGSGSPGTENLVHNPSTKEIVWSVGSIAKGAGITGASKEVSFQVAFTPSLSQVGTRPVIINDAVLTGYDDFANVDIRVNKASLSTQLTNDPAFPANGDRVVE